MSKIMNYASEWLETCGYNLGYHETMMPDIGHLDMIAEYNIPVWKYMGYMTEKAFYTDNHTNPDKPFKSVAEIIKENKMDKKEYWEGK
tara:strand:- start:11 stop:274 length:264 start_codon:yes stop_codon:yes gene_type:complete